MTARRFYCPNLRLGRLALEPDEAQHIRRVLRLAPGDHIHLFDGQGSRATGVIADTTRDVLVDVQTVTQAPPPQPWIDLATAVPKGSRADVLVEKAAELGADRWIPLLTERSVVDPREGKLDRFDRLAVAAAKQCGRDRLMLIDPPTDLKSLLQRAGEWDRLWIADTGESVQILPTDLATSQRVIILIGPEGGWSDAERNAAISSGFSPIRLGPHVLRIETAAMAALAICRQQA
jgi:16S rRNA (uracil1498-N3)-methyltransferase